MSYQLKVKAVSLAAEATIIRIEELKRLDRARTYTRQQLQRVSDRLNAVADRLAVIQNQPDWETNQETVEEEELVIRLMDLRNRKYFLEEKLAGWQPSAETQSRLRAEAHDLRNHRIGIVRDEARATHVARAYLAGRAYVEVEGMHNLIDPLNNGLKWDRVTAMVMKYGNKEQRDNYDAWLNNLGIVRQTQRIAPGNGRNIETFKKAA